MWILISFLPCISILLLLSYNGVITKAEPFHYYLLNATDYEKKVGSTKIRGWHGKTGYSTSDPIAFGPAPITRLEIPSKSKYPENGTYYLTDDVWYFILAGTASFGDIDASNPFMTGDLLWIQAAQPHGPITNIDSETLIVYVIGSLGEMSPQKDIISTKNPTYDQSMRKWTAWHSRITGSRYMTIGKGPNASISNPSSTRDYPCCDYVKWGTPGQECPYQKCHLNQHYHPRGAYYLPIVGNVSYANDYDYPVYINPGDVRWTQPGHYYGPEYCGMGCSFYAFHPGFDGVTGFDGITDVSFDPPPPGPYICQHNVTLTHIFNND